MAMTFKTSLSLALVVVVMASLWQPIASHGRLWTPPARSTMWRKHFDTPKNYQDNELFCGGFAHQKSLGGKCGICGDPYDGARVHEAGGKYAKGVIAGTYNQGQEMTIQVDLTANHKGWFEFKICPTNDFTKKATQECLDKYVLQLADGSGTKLEVTSYGSNMVDVPVILPADLHCDFCVLQWRYHAGNSWGTGSDGRSCVGCGLQEEFYGCSDIKILSSGGPNPERPKVTDLPPAPVTDSPVTSKAPKPSPQQTRVPTKVPKSTQKPTLPRREPTTTTTKSPEIPDPNNKDAPIIKVCRGLMAIPGLNDWCDSVCNLKFCPATHCECKEIPDPKAGSGLTEGCYATTPFSRIPGMDGWCSAVCRLGWCPRNKCFCVKSQAW